MYPSLKCSKLLLEASKGYSQLRLSCDYSCTNDDDGCVGGGDDDNTSENATSEIKAIVHDAITKND